MTKLEAKRKESNLTQKEVADEIDVSTSCYNMYENNQRKVPTSIVDKLSKLFKCETSDIFVPSTFTVSEMETKEI